MSYQKKNRARVGPVIPGQSQPLSLTDSPAACRFYQMLQFVSKEIFATQMPDIQLLFELGGE